MPRPRIAAVFGVRSDGIKMAPLARMLLQNHEVFDTKIIVTGQHHEMLDQVLQVFDLKPDIHLSNMREGLPLARLLAAMIDSLCVIFREHGFDLILAHGDTATALAAAQAGYFSGIRVGHVEAGLRTPDVDKPFPEEMNRRLVDRLSSVHFPPTESNRLSLVEDGSDRGYTYVTGQTGIDALRWIVDRRRPAASLPSLDEAEREGRRIILVTAHRRENWGEPLEHICHALLSLLGLYPDVHVVFAVHLNPLVRMAVHRLLAGHKRVTLIDAPDYLTFAGILQRSYLVLTDSGGLQEEGPALGKPVLVLRENTERPEAIAAGTVRMVGTDPDDIVQSTVELLSDETRYLAMARAVNPFGDGRACGRAVLGLQRYFGLTDQPFVPFRPSGPAGPERIRSEAAARS